MSTPSPLSGNPLLAIFAVSEALVSSSDYPEVLANLAAKIGEAMNVGSCDILTYDAEREILTFDALWTAEGLTADDHARLGREVRLADRPDLQEILLSAGPVERHVDDPGLPTAAREAIVAWGYKSMLEVPLRDEHEVLGVVGLQESRFARRFTQSERDLLGWLCELATLGIHNARLMRREQERGREVGAILSVNRALADSGDATPAFATIAATAADLLGAPRTALFSYRAATDTFTCEAAHRPDDSIGGALHGVAGTAPDVRIDEAMPASREPLVQHVSDASLPEAVRADLGAAGEATRVTVPIVHGSTLIGALLVAWTRAERLLTADELAMASCLSGQAALLLRNRELRSCTS
jgi:transcriptional regulator with GAF, ATPase, and Fis domain